MKKWKLWRYITARIVGTLAYYTLVAIVVILFVSALAKALRP